MACPYFIPEQRCESELWTHRARLPLGDGYSGGCCAPGHDGVALTDEMLKSACNLGNARCERLPADRTMDSVRFYVKSDEGSKLTVQYCAEREHRPVGHGVLTWDAATRKFTAAPELPVERLAEAFVQSHLQKFPRSVAARS